MEVLTSIVVVRFRVLLASQLRLIVMNFILVLFLRVLLASQLCLLLVLNFVLMLF